jgi:hypothetical protein
MNAVQVPENRKVMLKQWAAKVVSSLPAGPDDARAVLRYATVMLEGFVILDSARPDIPKRKR